MTDQLNSQLSAFVDDALSAEESELLVRRLCRDPELRNTMARYALIGNAVRGADAVVAPAEFSRRVMMGVDGQPMPSPAVAPPRPGSARQFGFAVAASVVLAAVALMTLPGRTPAPEAPVQLAAGVDTTATEAPTMTLVDIPVVQAPVVLTVDRQPPDASARLNNYLVQHVSATGSRQGAVAYRNVGYGTIEAEWRR